MTLETASFSVLSEELRRLASKFGLEKETEVQSRAIPTILAGESVLVISPTGSGKTEAVLLPIFQKIRAASPQEGIKALYITPLRALNRDMLRRIQLWARELELSVEVRHGDTPQKDRRRQSLHPPDILITTPETLQVLLIGSRLRSNLKSLKHVIVDEIHQLASERRGSQLSFALERLEKVVDHSFQRIGLSATVGNPEEIAQFLCGSGRGYRIVDTSDIAKDVVYSIEFPSPDRDDEIKSREVFVTPQTVARLERVIDLVDAHERTLVFVNSRTLAETLGSRLAMLGTKVGVHHGSLPKEERERVEQEFKEGKLKAMVCTSTLELGIDIGSVDLAIQYMSPRQVNSMVQRVGRSGHSLSKKSEGVILCVSPEDVLETLIIAKEAIARRPEPAIMFDSPLDVLSHQIAGLLLEYGEIGVEDVLKLSAVSYSFKSLTTDRILAVLSFMEKLGYVRLAGERATRRAKCRTYYLENLSMIRDERRYSVIDLSTHQKVGILGEEFMMIHAKIGIHFVIKGKAWKIESIQEDTVYVTPVQDPTAAIPGWDGELIPIPKTVAQGVGRERGSLEQIVKAGGEISQDKTTAYIEKAAKNLILSETRSQLAGSKIPTDTRVVIERFKNYLIVHTQAGDRINNTLGELFEERLLRMALIRNWWGDGYRILIELSTDEFALEEIAKKLFEYDDATLGFLNAVISKHFPFGYEMKFIAERFGALKRGRMLSGDALKELVVKFRFTPIYEETMKEAKTTKIDINGSLELLKDCKEGKVEIALADTKRPSPLAIYVLSRYAESEDYEESSANSAESMKASTHREQVSLLCFDCGNLEFVRVGDLPEKPACEKCSSNLLSVIFYGARFARDSWLKKRSRLPLTKEEFDVFSRARRSADVVLAYGKKGVIAQSVYGIGPQSAIRVLSKMHDSDEEFYGDLLRTKLKFIETKKYWD